MWSVVWEWLSANYPLLLGGFVIGGIVWCVARFYYTRFKKAEDAVKEISNKIIQLPCPKHDESFSQILEELTVIRTFLITKNPKSATLFSQKMSPRVLNAAGLSLYNEISGEKFIQDNKVILFRWMEAKSPKTALDVETCANEVLIENLDNSIFDDMKLWVYNSPTRKLKIGDEERDYSITINDICFILSIPLRDMYLSEHPEVKR